MLSALVQDREQIARWFGHFVTRTDNEYASEETASRKIHLSSCYQFEIGTRRAYYDDGHSSLLFVNGTTYSCPTRAAKVLSEQELFTGTELQTLHGDGEAKNVIDKLIAEGILHRKAP